MSTPILVEKFYERIWNAGDLGAITDVMASDFAFRGSLGTELIGHEAFKEYLGSIRGALADYRCEIIQCVAEGNHAFAKMRFSGRHVASFGGYAPTGKDVCRGLAPRYFASRGGLNSPSMQSRVCQTDASIKPKVEI